MLALGQVGYAVATVSTAVVPAGAPAAAGTAAGQVSGPALALAEPDARASAGNASTRAVSAADPTVRVAAARRPSRDSNRPPVALPVRAGTPISGEFGDFGSHWPTGHGGMDFNGETGDPIFAATSGWVTYAEFNYGGFGNLIMIKRGDGVQTWYAHLSRIGVRVGQRVQAGDLIGRMGSTGDSTGAHLHFEVRVGSVPTPTNPRSLLFGPNRGFAAKPPAWACNKWGC